MTNKLKKKCKTCIAAKQVAGPEAFKAVEFLERALNSLKYGQDEVSQSERCLPPAGAIIPPIV
jgi:hypothetical protein